MLFLLVVIIFFCNLYALLVIVSGIRRMRSLAHSKALHATSCPMVSIIVPACNEQDTIQPALFSLLKLDYPNTEVIVINDRSTDNTGEVLQAMQQDWPQLQIHDIATLPEGWLGKNHALHQGALLAKGEYLLFTDADILFAQSTLCRAVGLMLREKIDHLSLIFKNIAGGALLNAMMVDAGGGLFFLFRPWKVGERKNKHFMGVGAFNLVKKKVYMAIGGHTSVRMHPIDDIMLGKVIKQSGFKQECLTAYEFLQVRWYGTIRQMIHGLMKNIFALYDFRIAYATVAVVMIFLWTILPLWIVFFSTGMVQVFSLLSVCLRLLSTAYGAGVTGTTFWTVPFSLVTPYINIYVIIRGMVKTMVSDGIEWRGTHYPLNKLKESMSIL